MPQILLRHYTGPRALQPGEERPFLRFLNSHFGGLRWGLERDMPHVYGRPQDHRDWFNVVMHDGKIVAHTGIFPLEFVSPAGRAVAGGIGCVCTDPAHRGKGLMSALLLHVREVMRRRGMPFSILWGDRLRYMRYGWEPAGRIFSVGLYRRGSGSLARWDLPVARLVRPERYAEELHALHRGLPCRVERTPETFRLMLGRSGCEWYAARRGRRLAAYALVRGFRWKGEKRESARVRVEEWAGSDEGVLSLFRRLLGRPRVEQLNLLWPVSGCPVPPGLLEALDGWASRINYLAQFRVNDAADLLARYGKRRLAPAVARLRLGDRAAARLMFGPLSPTQLVPSAAARGLAGGLPLDLFMFPADHV